VFELDRARDLLWAAGVYVEMGMGCTGPVILVNGEDMEQAVEILVKEGLLSR